MMIRKLPSITYAKTILAPNARFLDVIPYIKSSWQQLHLYYKLKKKKNEFNFTSSSLLLCIG